MNEFYRMIRMGVAGHVRGNLKGALNEELLEISYNELEIYQDRGSLLVIA